MLRIPWARLKEHPLARVGPGLITASKSAPSFAAVSTSCAVRDKCAHLLCGGVRTRVRRLALETGEKAPDTASTQLVQLSSKSVPGVSCYYCK
jgi:hypothetical protein